MARALLGLRKKILNFFNWSSQTNTEITHAKYYNSISDIPLKNWIACTQGDYSFVKIGTAYPDEWGFDEQEAWFKIYDAYLVRYGLNKTYKKYLELMRKKALAQLDWVITRDRFKLTKIEIEEAKLNDMLSNMGNGMSIEMTLIYLAKWLGYRLDQTQITAEEYFNILEIYGKAN